jgi:hypothetical protein
MTFACSAASLAILSATKRASDVFDLVEHIRQARSRFLVTRTASRGVSCNPFSMAWSSMPPPWGRSPLNFGVQVQPIGAFSNSQTSLADSENRFTSIDDGIYSSGSCSEHIRRDM